MRVSPRIQLRPSPPGTQPPGSLRTSNISIVFLERGSSAHTGAGCAAIYLTSTELESKRQTVPSLDAPKSHSYGELVERFSVFAGPGRPLFACGTAIPGCALGLPFPMGGKSFSTQENA